MKSKFPYLRRIFFMAGGLLFWILASNVLADVTAKTSSASAPKGSSPTQTKRPLPQYLNYIEKLPNKTTRIKRLKVFTDSGVIAYIFFKGNPADDLRQDIRSILNFSPNQKLRLGNYTILSKGSGTSPQELIKSGKIVVKRGKAEFKDVTPAGSAINGVKIYTTYPLSGKVQL